MIKGILIAIIISGSMFNDIQTHTINGFAFGIILAYIYKSEQLQKDDNKSKVSDIFTDKESYNVYLIDVLTGFYTSVSTISVNIEVIARILS